MVINRDDILRTYNIGAILVSAFFAIFLPVFVSYSNHYFFFILCVLIFGANHIIIKRGYFKLAKTIFIISTHGLMLIFDDGVLSPTRGFVYYIPLLVCNLIILDYRNRWEQLLVMCISLICISLTSFADITPKIASLLYDRQHQIIMSYFNTFTAIAITLFMAYLLSVSYHESHTQLEQSKNLLNKSEQLIKSINQNIDIGIFRIKAETKEIVYINKAILNIFKYAKSDEVTEKSIFSYYFDNSQYERMMRILGSAHALKNVEVELRKKDGSKFWGLLSCYKSTDESGQKVIDGSLRDITPLKVLQQELLEAKNIAENNAKVKAQFLSNMSHEIRTPMNAVIGAINLIDNNASDDKDATWQMLKSASNNLMRLINDILDFSKMDSVKAETDPEVANLKKIIADTINTYVLEAKAKNIRLITEYELYTETFLLDTLRFSQVLNNLVSNAVKFTEKGYVKVSVTPLKEMVTHTTMLISVEDTGIGIAPQNKEKVFEYFSQENIGITRKYGGSGLGLAITKKIIEQFGSQIELQTEKDRGTKFSFTITLQKVNNQKEKTEPQTPLSLNGLKALIVEDNKMNAFILEKFLSKWDVSFDTCYTGSDSVRQNKAQMYDVVLMDLHMPDMDGFEATQQIKQHNTNAYIIAITADAFAETREKALANGMNDFISKPFDPAELFQKLAHITARKSAKQL
jgi:PAS domain S-box-containing protein